MDRRGALSAAAAAMLFGSAYVATAIALRGFSPIAAAAWRGLLGAVVLGVVLLLPPFAGLRPRGLGMPGLVRLGALALLGGPIFILAMNAAVATAGATVTAFVAGLYAVTAAGLAVPLLGERLERRTVLALLAALAGTLLLSDLRADADSLTGIAIALVAAVAFGLFLVLSRRWAAAYGLSGPVVGFASLSISAATALAILMAAGDPLAGTDPPIEALLAIGWLAAGPGAAAAVLVVAGMRRLEARHASAFLLLNPPTAALLSLVLLGQGLSPLQLIGAACVLAAIAVAAGVVPRRTASPRSSPPGSEPQPGS